MTDISELTTKQIAALIAKALYTNYPEGTTMPEWQELTPLFMLLSNVAGSRVVTEPVQGGEQPVLGFAGQLKDVLEGLSPLAQAVLVSVLPADTTNGQAHHKTVAGGTMPTHPMISQLLEGLRNPAGLLKQEHINIDFDNLAAAPQVDTVADALLELWEAMGKKTNRNLLN